MDEILKFLQENPTYYLSTVDEEGNPQCRPFGTIALIDGDLCIQTGKVKACYQQMVAHPRVSICTMGKRGEWLRLEADAVPDDSVATCEAMLSNYASLRKTYAPGDGNCVVIRLRNVRATISSFTAEPKVYEF